MHALQPVWKDMVFTEGSQDTLSIKLSSFAFSTAPDPENDGRYERKLMDSLFALVQDINDRHFADVQEKPGQVRAAAFHTCSFHACTPLQSG
jgi:hypothetical protein